MQLRLLEIVDRHLGSGVARKNGKDRKYFCPFCPDALQSKYHAAGKRKLELNVSTEQWKCWSCLKAGRSVKSLLNQLKVDFDTVKEVISLSELDSTTPYSDRNPSTSIQLPVEYKRLWVPAKSTVYKRALQYCTVERKMTPYDIIKYRVGYCESGPYKDRIILPSYDKAGYLNFFTARALYKGMGLSYKTPDASKNIIFHELFINWNEPIVIVEGPFDAISVKRNVIPLLGKTFSDYLAQSIIRNKPPGVYIALDPDAKLQSVKYIEYFLSKGVPTYFLDLPADPGEVGFDKITPILKRLEPLTIEDLIKLQFSL